MDSTGDAPPYDDRGARLAGDRREQTIAGRQEGESSGTAPWAMVVDSDRRCWLRANYTIHDRPGGTVAMKVERREDGFHVWVPDDWSWSIASRAEIAVAALHG